MKRVKRYAVFRYPNPARDPALNASRLFLYKVTRNLLHLTGDTGALLHNTMAAMTLFGVPPEEYYPYDVPRFDEEPPAFCYAFAQNYQAISYYRLDPPDTSRADLLQRGKTLISSGLPSMFGFTVFSSYSQANVISEKHILKINGLWRR